VNIRSLLLLFVASGCATALAGEAWLYPAPQTLADADWTDLPHSDLFQVLAPKESAAAITRLAQRRFEPLTLPKARSYVGARYTCAPGKRPFLVRAIYIQSATGDYTLSRWHRLLRVCSSPPTDSSSFTYLLLTAIEVSVSAHEMALSRRV
jgi:hypothetical protein